MQEFARIIIRNSTDSPRLFGLALQSAGFAGLTPTDQVRFASAVVDLFFISNFAEGVVVFRAGHNSENQAVLQAVMEETDLFSEMIIPVCPLAHQLLPTSQDDLQQRSSDMEHFTVASSHELKNSLTKLKLAVSLLETDDDPNSIRHHIGIIQRSSGQLERTLTDLNEIINIKQDTPAIKPLALASVFSGVCNDLQDKISAAQATVTTDLGGISDWRYVEAYLHRIFSNLLSNSLKYTYANRRPEILIKATKKGGSVDILFTDNGQGIDLGRYKNNLFTPFSQFSSARQEGKGLGLFIIKTMIERNGGTIEVNSIPGTGTTFSITLREY